MKNLLKAKDLNFYYGEDKILDNINISFEQGRFIGITGKNGSGKSTLARLLAGLERPHSGGVFFQSKELNEENLSDIRPHISMVFQNPNNQLIANKLMDDMAFGLENLGTTRANMNRIIYEIARKLEIEELLQKNPQELSGGQKQIAAIGGVLVFNPKILILDEITSMLDISSKKRVFSLIKKLKEDHTIIMISHDSRELMETDKIIILDKGRISEELKANELFKDDRLLEKYKLEKPFEYELIERLGKEKYERLGTCYGSYD